MRRAAFLFPLWCGQRTAAFDPVHIFAYHPATNSAEFLRWLKSKGATFDRSRGKGSQMYVTRNGRTAVVPTHGTEMRTGTVEAIKKQLGLKGER